MIAILETTLLASLAITVCAISVGTLLKFGTTDERLEPVIWARWVCRRIAVILLFMPRLVVRFIADGRVL